MSVVICVLILSNNSLIIGEYLNNNTLALKADLVSVESKRKLPKNSWFVLPHSTAYNLSDWIGRLNILFIFPFIKISVSKYSILEYLLIYEKKSLINLVLPVPGSDLIRIILC